MNTDKTFKPAKTVAILCAAKNSVYHKLDGVKVFDKNRDARTFAGGMPIVAHPPCRGWSVKMAHFAKPEPGEKEMGIWVAEQVKQCGGILEQPANSRLWAAAHLPPPGQTSAGESWSMEVLQYWWGHPIAKPTWLYFSKINPLFVCYPFKLHAAGRDAWLFDHMSHKQRSATVRAFAEWLVNLARQTGRPALDRKA